MTGCSCDWENGECQAPDGCETVTEVQRLWPVVSEMRAALKPFADFLNNYEQKYPGLNNEDDEPGWLSSFGRITFGDLRRARAALSSGQ